MFLYYERGNPRAVVCPDAYVALGVPGHERRTYKLWAEGVPPVFVMEISSKKTWLEDEGNKKAVYARIGVREYFLFDPECDYLDPRLQGYVLVDGEYRRLKPRADGSLESRALGIVLSVEDDKLRATDLSTGQRLLRPEDWLVVGENYRRAEEGKREAEEGKREAEEGKREAEARAARAEEELERLRREIERRD
jgi:hypothetical protein